MKTLLHTSSQYIAIAMMTAVALTVCAHTQANVIHVPDDYPTIQQAIDAAEDGTTIIVAPGTYIETISFSGKEIHLSSSAGPEKTIIDAEGAGAVVTAASGEGPGTMLQGFTITGGNASIGGGMHNVGSSPTIKECIFNDNMANVGGAMHNLESTVTVIDTVFQTNAAHFGGAVYNEQSTVHVEGGLIVDNFSTHWAAAVQNENSNLTISNSEISHNLAWQVDGVISNYAGSHLTILDSVVTHNSMGAWWGTGGGIFNSGTLEVGGTFFCQNLPGDIFQHPTIGSWNELSENEFTPIADFNCDGVVNVLDLLFLLEQWGECPDMIPGNCPADLDADGSVDVLDLLILLEKWGSR